MKRSISYFYLIFAILSAPAYAVTIAACNQCNTQTDYINFIESIHPLDNDVFVLNFSSNDARQFTIEREFSPNLIIETGMPNSLYIKIIDWMEKQSGGEPITISRGRLPATPGRSGRIPLIPLLDLAPGNYRNLANNTISHLIDRGHGFGEISISTEWGVAGTAGGKPGGLTVHRSVAESPGVMNPVTVIIQYDAGGELILVFNKNNNTIEFSYATDAEGELIPVTDDMVAPPSAQGGRRGSSFRGNYVGVEMDLRAYINRWRSWRGDTSMDCIFVDADDCYDQRGDPIQNCARVSCRGER